MVTIDSLREKWTRQIDQYGKMIDYLQYKGMFLRRPGATDEEAARDTERRVTQMIDWRHELVDLLATYPGTR